MTSFVRPRTRRRNLAKLVIPLSLAALVGCGENHSAQNNLDAARKSFEARDYESAQIELQNALETNPNDGNARLLLARAFIEFGNGKAAEIQLEKAASLAILEEELMIPRLKAWMLQKNYDSVTDLPPRSFPESVFTKVQRAEILGIQGIAHLALNEEAEARAKIAQAISIDPNCGVALVGQAQLTLKNGDENKGTEEARRVTELAPSYAPGWSLLGDLYRNTKQLESAEQAYTKAIELRTASHQDLLLRALVRISRDDLPGAKADIARLRKAGFEVPHAAFADGIALLREGQPAAAKDQFEQVVSKHPNYMAAVCYLGQSFAQTASYERAAAHLKTCLKTFPEVGFVRRIYASVLFLNNLKSEAQAVLAPLLESGRAEVEDLDLMAQLKLATGKPEDAVKLLQQAVERDTKVGHTYLNLGFALVASGKIEESRDAFAKAGDVDSKLVNTPLIEANALMKAGKFGDAIERLEQVRKKKPKDLQTLNLLAIANIQAGEKQAARAILEEALTIDPNYDIGAVNLAGIYAQDGEFARAEKLLEPVLQREPSNAQVLGISVALDVNTGKAERARQRLQTAIERAPDNPDLQLLRARFEKGQGELERAIETYSALVQKPNARPDWFRELCTTQLSAGRFSAAVDTAQRLVELPSPLAMDYLLLARASRQVHDGANARRALARALILAPDDPSVRLENIRAMIDAREVKSAREAMIDLKGLVAPQEVPDILFIDSQISVLEKNNDNAIKSAERAFDLDPSGGRVIDLARVYATSGEKSKAVNALEKWVTANPTDTAVIFVLADAHEKTGDKDKARKTYETLLKLVPDEPLALNNLAWLLREQDAATALKLAEKANKTAPGAPGIMDTYGVLLLDQGDARKSIEVLRDAAEKAPRNPSIAIHLATSLLRNGNTQEAMKVIGKIEPEKIPKELRAEYDLIKRELGPL